MNRCHDNETSHSVLEAKYIALCSEVSSAECLQIEYNGASGYLALLFNIETKGSYP